MGTPLKDIYENLEKCAEQLEIDVKKSWQGVARIVETRNENNLVLDKTCDYHYKEILSHLKDIKKHLETIANHDKQIQALQNRTSTKIDKNYIRKQVAAFQNYGEESVRRREKKQSRTSDESSAKYLESWENYLENHHQLAEKLGTAASTSVKKRNIDGVRKKKKLVSSTMGEFLEATLEDDESLKSLKEDSASEEEGGSESTKPRIVEFIYKKS